MYDIPEEALQEYKMTSGQGTCEVLWCQLLIFKREINVSGFHLGGRGGRMPPLENSVFPPFGIATLQIEYCPLYAHPPPPPPPNVF